jgi:CHAT domain-containing protein
MASSPDQGGCRVIDRVELAGRLAAADDAERAALLTQHVDLADVELVRALKALFERTRQSDPPRAAGAAAGAQAVSDLVFGPQAPPAAGRPAAMESEGLLEMAVVLFERGRACGATAGRANTGALTPIREVRALAAEERYDDALAVGLAAREAFLRAGDLRSTGEVELSLGDIAFQRGHLCEAERRYTAARDRFAAIDNGMLLAQVDIRLGAALAEQHRFRGAAAPLARALERAEKEGLEVLATEARYRLGRVLLFKGSCDSAAEHLELARHRYAVMGLARHAAYAEQDLADAYLGLRLAPEAAAISARAGASFAALGMTAEQARACTCRAHATLLLGLTAEAQELLCEARALYLAAGEAAEAAFATLVGAHVDRLQGRHPAAARAAAEAVGAFGASERLLLARWLQADAARAQGQTGARELLEGTLRDAEAQAVSQVAHRCYTSLGQLAAERGEDTAAAICFGRAVELLDGLRAPLPADELAAAPFVDKRTPYTELARLSLRAGGATGLRRALEYVERARACTLADTLADARETPVRPCDPAEAALLSRRDDLREELNWLYSQLRGRGGDSADATAPMRAAVREREDRITRVTRRVARRRQMAGAAWTDPGRLQRALGGDTALVEYFALEGTLQALVVTDEGVEVARNLAREDEVEAALRELRFQIGTFRHGIRHRRSGSDQLAARARGQLARLHDLLLGPLEARLGNRRLAVVPHRALHYVPFHALYDGTTYQVERREVVQAPTADVLERCLARPRGSLRSALLVGTASARGPAVEAELIAAAPLFRQATVLLNKRASLAELRQRAPGADVIHLACPVHLRPDNPLFSSLRLADGRLSLREARALDWPCELVVLSSCEIGLSAVAPGDEVVGLAHALLPAVTPSLLVSLWAVDDESTADLMASFYRYVREGFGFAAALRQAQREGLGRRPHPFFWSALTLLGRW